MGISDEYVAHLTDQQRVAALRQDIAAKDREIAELRARVEEVQRIRDEWYLEAKALGRACDAAVAERDETRECVGRLQRASQAVIKRWHSPMWEWCENGPTADLMNDLRDALAATPEHLRGRHQSEQALPCADHS